MAHEELKALYEIDRQHSDDPDQYWEFKVCPDYWIGACNPGFFANVEYRRKPDAPVWYPIGRHPAGALAEDARKWRELEEQVNRYGGISAAIFNDIRHGKPRLIQGYTAEQWQAIIDGGFLCEFSDCEWEADSKFIVSTLTTINETSRVTFSSPVGDGYSYCRPLRIKGVRQPWFGGECPVSKDAKVLVKLRSGQIHEASTGSHLYWGHNRASYNIVEFIEL